MDFTDRRAIEFVCPTVGLLFAVSVLNAPAPGVVTPTDAPLIVPPVIFTFAGL